MLKLLLIPLFLYLAVTALIYFAQDRVLFPAPPEEPPPPGSDRLELGLAAGERLHGVLIRAARPNPERLLILGFGGNGWNAGDVADFLSALYPAADVAAFHYRGYAPSGGRASAAALVADAPLVLDHVRELLEPRRVVAVGFSIGSGVAASLASAREVDGLILVTPFDSLAAVGAGHYPWLPVRLLFRHDIDAAAALQGTNVPVAIVSASNDTLIPPARADALRRAVPNLVFDRTIQGAGHNDIYRRDAFEQAMQAALPALLAAKAPQS
jgi:hypothetical protein